MDIQNTIQNLREELNQHNHNYYVLDQPTISDYEFIRRVDQNIERFAKGDSLICMVDVRQWQTANGVRTDYDVTEVLEHRQASRQIHLPLN